MKNIIERGKAIAKSAEWISEDKRLKVTSELIPDYSLKAWRYNVRVTVTNIGDKPLKRVFMFIFPYVGDKLCEYWDPISYSYEVRDLYVGENASFTFVFLPEDMTSYKILVVGG